MIKVRPKLVGSLPWFTDLNLAILCFLISKRIS